MSALVQRVIREAKQRTEPPKAAALAAKMAPLLGGFVYGETSISAWISGRDRPSAEALLAAAQVSGISLDEILYGKSLPDQLQALRDEQAAQREDMRALGDLVRGLGNRGIP